MTPNRRITVGVLLGLTLTAGAWFALRPPSVQRTSADRRVKDVYYCPMHTDYHSDKPGNCPICNMKLVKLEPPAAPVTPDNTATPRTKDIFVSPEKQQLVGMRSVAAVMGTLTKDIRIAGKVSYDETKVTHIHTKVSGYIEEVFADSIGKPVRAGDPLFTIYSPDLVSTEQDFLLALKSRSLLRDSILASASQGADNLVAAARERLRLWDVTDREIRTSRLKEK